MKERTMSAEETVRSYVAAFNASDVKAIASHYAPSTVYRQPFSPDPLTTPAEVEAFESGMFAGFSDVAVELVWIVANGDVAAAGTRVLATHTADMPLPDGGVLPATGTRLVLETGEYMRVDDAGRIVEHQRYLDGAGMMAQLTAHHTAS